MYEIPYLIRKIKYSQREMFLYAASDVTLARVPNTSRKLWFNFYCILLGTHSNKNITIFSLILVYVLKIHIL